MNIQPARDHGPRSKRLQRKLAILALGLLWALGGCSKTAAPLSGGAQTSPAQSAGTIEVTARLVEIPEGAIFQRELYDYATVMKYEVLSVKRGALAKGSTIYVGHYNPWKPRGEVADNRARNVGGTLQSFRARKVHHMALEASMEDQFMGGVVDKYFEKHTGPTYWAVWTESAE